MVRGCISQSLSNSYLRLMTWQMLLLPLFPDVWVYFLLTFSKCITANGENIVRRRPMHKSNLELMSDRGCYMSWQNQRIGLSNILLVEKKNSSEVFVVLTENNKLELLNSFNFHLPQMTLWLWLWRLCNKCKLYIFNAKYCSAMQGVVYMDESVLGWRPLAEAWLANRSPQESHVSFTSEQQLI